MTTYLISLCILVWLREFIFLHHFALFLLNQKPNIGLIKLEIQNFQGRYELNSAIRSLDFDPLFFYNEKKKSLPCKMLYLSPVFFFFFRTIFVGPLWSTHLAWLWYFSISIWALLELSPKSSGFLLFFLFLSN
jgi:hypothetical protein